MELSTENMKGNEKWFILFVNDGDGLLFQRSGLVIQRYLLEFLINSVNYAIVLHRKLKNL